MSRKITFLLILLVGGVTTFAWGYSWHDFIGQIYGAAMALLVHWSLSD